MKKGETMVLKALLRLVLGMVFVAFFFQTGSEASKLFFSDIHKERIELVKTINQVNDGEKEKDILKPFKDDGFIVGFNEEDDVFLFKKRINNQLDFEAAIFKPKNCFGKSCVCSCANEDMEGLWIGRDGESHEDPNVAQTDIKTKLEREWGTRQMIYCKKEYECSIIEDANFGTSSLTCPDDNPNDCVEGLTDGFYVIQGFPTTVQKYRDTVNICRSSDCFSFKQKKEFDFEEFLEKIWDCSKWEQCKYNYQNKDLDVPEDLQPFCSLGSSCQEADTLFKSFLTEDSYVEIKENKIVFIQNDFEFENNNLEGFKIPETGHFELPKTYCYYDSDSWKDPEDRMDKKFTFKKEGRLYVMREGGFVGNYDLEFDNIAVPYVYGSDSHQAEEVCFNYVKI